MRLLLIESNAETGRARMAQLAKLGFTAEWVRCLDDEHAARLVESAGYHVVVLGFGSSWTSQWQALQRLLDGKPCAVLVTGPREALPEIEHALQAGAEDFLIEPVDTADLAVRIRACARRSDSLQSATAGGRLRLNPVQRIAVRDGTAVPLTACEYLILAILMTEPGRIVSRASLEQQLYAGAAAEVGSNTVQVYIHNLRRKLGEGLVRTARGRGYWVDPGDVEQ